MAADLWRQPHHVVLEIRNEQCKIIKQLASLGISHLRVVDIRGSQKHSVKHMIEFDQEEMGKIPSEIKIIRRKGEHKGKALALLETEGCDVCSAILSSDAFLVSGKSLQDFRIMYSFMVPSFEAYRQIVTKIENTGRAVNVLKMGQFEQRKGVLTVNQEKIFWLALESGFFDYPRRMGISELATKLGISSATLSEIIRRGTRRLLEHHFKDQPS